MQITLRFCYAFLLFLCAGSPLFSQVKLADSLVLALSKAQDDTSKIKILLPLSFELRSSEADSALKYAKNALSLSRKIGSKRYEAKALNNMGLAYMYKSDYPNAINCYNSSLRLGFELKDSTHIALEYSQLGNLYKAMTNFPMSIDYHKKSLAIRERINDTVMLSQSCVNLGNSYVRNSQYDKALTYFLKGLNVLKGRENSIEYANTLNGLANVYLFQKDERNAIVYYQRSFEVYNKNENSKGMNTVLVNLGNCYSNLKMYDSALYYLHEGEKISAKTKNRNEIAMEYLTISAAYEALENYAVAIKYASKAVQIFNDLDIKSRHSEAQLTLAQLYFKSGNSSEGRKHLEKGLALTSSISDPQVQIAANSRIAECYSLMGDHVVAYKYLKRNLALKDSLYSTNNIQAIAQMQSAFDLKAKESEIEILNTQKQMSDYQINKQQTIILSLVASAILFILMVFFIYRGYKRTRAANSALSFANEEINEKNKNISDSIKYAKNIQNALLKLPQFFLEEMKDDYFIFYRPKDIVSGDFYWVEKVGNFMLVAAVDCTGHGVPGSLMSMLGVEKLKQAVREKGLTRPSEILSFVNRSFKETLSGSGNDAFLRDGMDIALCCFDLQKKSFEYAGANRPLWISGKDENGQNQITEIRATKAAIGGFTSYEQSFESHAIKPSPNDTIYLFTDGFTDQFGGENNKKYNIKRFREMLSSISSLPMNEQEKILNSTFDEWKGRYEQIDDVLVIGVRVR
jgi:serine phosphatase RsbU (regulator of sigma subunit)